MPCTGMIHILVKYLPVTSDQMCAFHASFPIHSLQPLFRTMLLLISLFSRVDLFLYERANMLGQLNTYLWEQTQGKTMTLKMLLNQC